MVRLGLKVHSKSSRSDTAAFHFSLFILHHSLFQWRMHVLDVDFACPQRSIRCADAIQNGESSPTGYFPQAPIFPLKNAGEFRDLRIATRALPSTCELFEKSSTKNFNTVLAGCVVQDLCAQFQMIAQRYRRFSLFILHYSLFTLSAGSKNL